MGVPVTTPSGLKPPTKWANTPRTMKTMVGGSGSWPGRLASMSCVVTAAIALASLPACDVPPVDPLNRNGRVGGRVLVAPGVPLVGAQVEVDQLNLFDGKAEVRMHIGERTTDGEGTFAGLPTSLNNGLFLFTASGGSFTDLVTGTKIQLDPSQQLKAVHWLGLFEDRGETSAAPIYVTPVHSLIEARFRYKMDTLKDTNKAVDDAYEHVGKHFGGLDWDRVIPADVSVAATSPTDEERAAFVLGGLSVMADDIRVESTSTSQVVNVMTLVHAMELDVGDALLDGNDMNSNALGMGLQVGECVAPALNCESQLNSCPLSTCRTGCDLYANSYRSTLAGSTSKFIGSRTQPSVWNRTTLGTEDARTLIDGIARNVDADLFAKDACIETADRVPPTIGWQTTYDGVSVDDGGVIKGTLTLRVVATDDTDLAPIASFMAPVGDGDGDAANSVAVAMVDTRVARVGDGPLTVTAIARDLAGNQRMDTRTFQVDNTAPAVTVESTGIFVDPAGVWWTGTDAPTLHGTVDDPSTARVEIVIGGVVVATAALTGTMWVAQLPAGALTASDNVITIRGIDSAGNAGLKVQTVRLDKTPPSVVVAPSLVSNESFSTFQFVDDVFGSRAVHTTHGTPVDLSTESPCPQIAKHVHLLSQPGPGNTHTVLGSDGDLNPLAFNVVLSDDGVGIQPGTAQYRVGIPAINFLTGWTPMPPGSVNGSTTNITLPLYRDGATGIPTLGTTNGEYHIELRATDRFGRTTTTARCWTHVILAPPLSPTTQSGEKGEGFPRALFSTSLTGGPGRFTDFAEKFLNDNAEGAALWRWRVKNYLGEPVYVTVKITQGVQAQVTREFAIRNTLINPRIASSSCGTQPCAIAQPIEEYRSTFTTFAPTSLALRARLFDQADSEVGLCPGCTSDDTTQTYVFQIPARTSSSVAEYSFLTYLLPRLPAGQGTDVTMAPSDANQPDNGPYSEFFTVTGKLMGPPGTTPLCIDQDNDSGTFTCIQKAVRQRYRALTRIRYQVINDVVTSFSSAANLLLPSAMIVAGRLPGNTPESALSSDEGPLP